MKTPITNPDRTISFSMKSAKVRRKGSGRVPVAACLLALAATMGGTSVLAQQTQPVSQSIILADFNHDGIPDELVQSSVTPEATIAFGSVPYGTFSGNVKAVTFPAACTALPAGAIAVGDFNGDGFPDIVFFCNSTAGIMLGNGDGTFGAAATLQGAYAGPAVVGDFDKDGKLDLVVLVTTGDSVLQQTIQLLTGKGDGTFNAPVLTGLAASTYSSVAVADINGDGYPDLLLMNSPASATPTLEVLANNKNETFGAGTQGSYAGNAVASVATTGATTILVGNFFGTATTDVVVSGTGVNGQVFAFQNKSTATAYAFNDPVTTSVANLTGAQAGKFTGSGFTDIAVANGTKIAVLANDGRGNFAASYPTLTLVSAASKFAVADANNDGYADMYTASLPVTGPLQLGVSLTTGSATATSLPFSPAAGTRAISAAWAGNVNFTGSSATGSQIVDGLPSTTLVLSSRNPSVVGTAVSFLVSVAPTTGSGPAPTGSVVLTDVTATGTAMLITGTLDGTGSFTYNTSSLTQGTRVITAAYAGDALYAPSNGSFTQVVNHAPVVTPTLTWATPAAIVYGTGLSPLQLNAAATDTHGAAVAGTYAYTPATGTILDAGTQFLSVTFTPADPLSFSVVTRTVSLLVSKAAPVVTWATPASIVYGTPLSATQLNAAADVPGVFTYMPTAGAVLAPGTQTLSVSFTPINAVDYAVATQGVSLVVSGATVVSFTPTTVPIGSAATTITVTGTGFASNSVVQVNGTAIQTGVVSATKLTATLPASYFTAAGKLAITVFDPTVNSTSAPVDFTVTAATPVVILDVPATTDPGTQPTVTLALAAPYPVDITATVSLSFAASTTPAVDDPSIVFEQTGTRTQAIAIPAGTTTVPAIQLQAGTVAGTITLPITLTAGTINVTPASLTPGVIVVPPAVPTVSSVTATRSGHQLTVVIRGFSNTREIANAKFHFTPATGASLGTTDLTILGEAIFNANWFQTTASDPYGSTFTYTQLFNLSDDATTVGGVDVTLSNTVGASDMKTAQ